MYHFHSILHVPEFPDTLSYVARTMSDKRSFEQLFCQLLKVLCIQQAFCSISSNVSSLPNIVKYNITVSVIIFSSLSTKGGECDRIFTNFISLVFIIIYISLISQLTKGEWSWKQVVTKYRIPLHGPCSMLKLTNPNITKRRCQIKWQTFFVTCELLMLNLIIISLTLISFHHCILSINLERPKLNLIKLIIILSSPYENNFISFQH